MNKNYNVLLVFLLFVQVNACKYERGLYWTHDELIDRAQTIILVKLKRKSESHSYLHTIKTLKGKSKKNYKVPTFKYDYDLDNDFNEHRDSIFWSRDTGRTPFWGCSPNHRFLFDRLYVYFPDALGSLKSAEVIKDTTDQWLKYITARLTDDICSLESDYFNQLKKLQGTYYYLKSNTDLQQNRTNVAYEFINIINDEGRFFMQKGDGDHICRKECSIVYSYGKLKLPSCLETYSYLWGI